MAFSILSLGMLAARAFCRMRRRAGLLSALGPPDFTPMAMSFPIRVKALAILSHRLNMVALRVSKMRPMTTGLPRRGPVDLSRRAWGDVQNVGGAEQQDAEVTVGDRGALGDQLSQ